MTHAGISKVGCRHIEQARNTQSRTNLMNSADIRNYLQTKRPELLPIINKLYVDDMTLPEGFYAVIEKRQAIIWAQFLNHFNEAIELADLPDSRIDDLAKSMRNFMMADWSPAIGETISLYCECCYKAKNPLRRLRIWAQNLWASYLFAPVLGIKATAAQVNEAIMYRYLLDYLGG